MTPGDLFCANDVNVGNVGHVYEYKNWIRMTLLDLENNKKPCNRLYRSVELLEVNARFLFLGVEYWRTSTYSLPVECVKVLYKNTIKYMIYLTFCEHFSKGTFIQITL